jgi:hypothetical protein
MVTFVRPADQRLRVRESLAVLTEIGSLERAAERRELFALVDARRQQAAVVALLSRPVGDAARLATGLECL